MRLRACFEQRESLTQCRAQPCSVIAHNGQAATFFRAIQRKGGDDGVAAGLQGLGQSRDIARAVRRRGKKMKGGPVVPEIIGALRAPLRRIGGDP